MRFLRQWTKSVETTEKSVVAKDLVCCLKKVFLDNGPNFSG
jgi:hypothetical protein